MGQGATKLLQSVARNKTESFDIENMNTAVKKPLIPSLRNKRSSFRSSHEIMSEERFPSTESTTESSGLSQSTSENSLYSSRSAEPKSQTTRPRANSKGSLGDTRTGTHTPVIVEEKNQKPKKKKDVKRAEIVAAVTRRLYSNSKKPEMPSADSTSAAVDQLKEEEEEELEELKLCARARLQELTKRALNNRKVKQKSDVDTQTDFHTSVLRVKEIGTSTELDPPTWFTLQNFKETPTSFWSPTAPIYIIGTNQLDGTHIMLTHFPQKTSNPTTLKDVYLNAKKNKIPWTYGNHQNNYSTNVNYETLNKIYYKSTDDTYSDDSLEYNNEEMDECHSNKSTTHQVLQFSSLPSFSCDNKSNVPPLKYHNALISASTGTQTLFEEMECFKIDSVNNNDTTLKALFKTNQLAQQKVSVSSKHISIASDGKQESYTQTFCTSAVSTQTVYSSSMSTQTEYVSKYSTSEISLLNINHVLQDCDSEVPIMVMERQMTSNKNGASKVTLSVSENLLHNLILTDIGDKRNIKPCEDRCIQTEATQSALEDEKILCNRCFRIKENTKMNQNLQKIEGGNEKRICEKCMNTERESKDRLQQDHDFDAKNKIKVSSISKDEAEPLQSIRSQNEQMPNFTLQVTYPSRNSVHPQISLSFRNEDGRETIRNEDISHQTPILAKENNTGEMSEPQARSNCETENRNTNCPLVNVRNQNYLSLIRVIRLMFIALMRYPSLIPATNRTVQQELQNNTIRSTSMLTQIEEPPALLESRTETNYGEEPSITINSSRYLTKSEEPLSGMDNAKCPGAFPKYQNNLNSCHTKTCNKKISVNKRCSLGKQSKENLTTCNKNFNRDNERDFDSSDDEFQLPRTALGVRNECNNNNNNELVPTIQKQNRTHWDDLRHIILGRNNDFLQNVNSNFDEMHESTKKKIPAGKIQKSVSWSDLHGNGVLYTDIENESLLDSESDKNKSQPKPILNTRSRNFPNDCKPKNLEKHAVFNEIFTRETDNKLCSTLQEKPPPRRWSVSYHNKSTENECQKETPEELSQLANLLKEAKNLVRSLNETSSTSQNLPHNIQQNPILKSSVTADANKYLLERQQTHSNQPNKIKDSFFDSNSVSLQHRSISAHNIQSTPVLKNAGNVNDNKYLLGYHSHTNSPNNSKSLYSDSNSDSSKDESENTQIITMQPRAKKSEAATQTQNEATQNMETNRNTEVNNDHNTAIKGTNEMSQESKHASNKRINIFEMKKEKQKPCREIQTNISISVDHIQSTEPKSEQQIKNAPCGESNITKLHSELFCRNSFQKLCEKVNEIETKLNTTMTHEKVNPNNFKNNFSESDNTLCENKQNSLLSNRMLSTKISENWEEECCDCKTYETCLDLEYPDICTKSLTNLTKSYNCPLCNKILECYSTENVSRTSSMPNVSLYKNSNRLNTCHNTCHKCFKTHYNNDSLFSLWLRQNSIKANSQSVVRNYVRRKYQSPRAYLQYLLQMRRTVVQESSSSVIAQSFKS